MKKNETKCAVVESKNERGKERKSEREREREILGMRISRSHF